MLASEHCVPCAGAKPLTAEESRESLKSLPGWILKDGLIEKEFHFNSYASGLEFAYAVGRVAEEENHHPDMIVGWRRVKVMLSTHAIKGLSRNDFIMAAKSESKYASHKLRAR